MDRRSKVLIAGAGAVASFYVVSRAVGGRHIDTLPYGYGIKIKKSVIVNCPAEQLYQHWRDLTNLPQLFGGGLSVELLDSTRSHWTLRAPGRIDLEWDAEITVDRDGEMIGWRSLEGADLDNAGYVRFERSIGGRRTVVRVALQYNPPAGKIGAALSALMGERPESRIEEALRKFKQRMEAGGSSTGTNETGLPHSPEPVEMASEDSFPASDPPSWTGTT